MNFEGDLTARMRQAVSLSWCVFAEKVGHGIIPVNKEASMQLQYAYVLQQVLPLIRYHKEESLTIELETTVSDGVQNREVDILFIGKWQNNQTHRIAIEMKCYKTIASSGGKRGATDIFMKDVYQDLHLLERYCEQNNADRGIALVMNDYRNFIFPKKKDAKCWDYDISDGAEVENVRLTTPIGGKDVDIKLLNKYQFNWKQVEGYWFTELERL